MDKTIENALERDWNKLSEAEKNSTNLEEFTTKWLNELVDKGLPQFMDDFSQSASKGEKRRREIAEDIKQKWKGSRGTLLAFIEYCAEVGEHAFKAETLDALQYVMRRCHAKALQITREVMLLLDNGYPDAAMARWRTMHEVNVISAFVKKHGLECATRYIHHQEIDRLKSLRKHNECAEELGWKPVPEASIMAQEQVQKELVESYGKNFKSPYGWAEAFTNHPAPNFTTLAVNAGYGHWTALYKASSYSIHSSYTGLIGTSINPNLNEETWLVGQSGEGLLNPAQLVAISFCQVTIRTISLEQTTEKLPDLIALSRLLSELIKSLKAELM